MEEISFLILHWTHYCSGFLCQVIVKEKLYTILQKDNYVRLSWIFCWTICPKKSTYASLVKRIFKNVGSTMSYFAKIISVYKRLSLIGEHLKAFPLDKHNFPSSKRRMFPSRMCKPTSTLPCQCSWTSFQVCIDKCMDFTSFTNLKKSRFEKCVVIKALVAFHLGLVFGSWTCLWFLWRRMCNSTSSWVFYYYSLFARASSQPAT